MDEALRAGDPEAFTGFYREQAAPLLAYFARRVADTELAADLCAETFAAALDGCHRYDPARGPAVAWLYGIARHQLSGALQRGRVEDRARRRLGMEPLVLTDLALERLESLISAEATAGELDDALAALPDDQREAILARVVDEQDYASIARRAETSESVIRKRVSRGLSGLRARMEGTSR